MQTKIRGTTDESRSYVELTTNEVRRIEQNKLSYLKVD